MKKIEIQQLIIELQNLELRCKSKPFKQAELLQIQQRLGQIVNNLFLLDEDFLSQLLQITNHQPLIFKVKPPTTLWPESTAEVLLHLLKSIFSHLLDGCQEYFNYYIYSEIKQILTFYIRQTTTSTFYDNAHEPYSLTKDFFHHQNMVYKYLFSLFDKFLYINLFIVKKYHLQGPKNKLDHYRFNKDFVAISQVFFQDLKSQKAMRSFLGKLDKTTTFHYLRMLRNAIEHSFVDPDALVSLALPTQLLFIVINRVILEVGFDFKSDSEIYELLQKQINK